MIGYTIIFPQNHFKVWITERRLTRLDRDRKGKSVWAHNHSQAREKMVECKFTSHVFASCQFVKLLENKSSSEPIGEELLSRRDCG